MSDMHCHLENRVSEAIQTERWPEDLRSHAAECPLCADLVLVAECLHLESEVEDLRPLPDPGYIWWRAQIEARVAKGRRATRAIVVMQAIAVACTAVVSLAGIIWAWPSIRGSIATLLPDSATSSLPAGIGHPGLVIFISLLVVTAMTVNEIFSGMERAGR